MPVLINAVHDRSTGWVALTFPYNARVKDALKAFPGVVWQPETPTTPKHWAAPANLLPILQRPNPLFRLDLRETTDPKFEGLKAPSEIYDRLKPFQQTGVQRLLQNPGGYLLTMEMRTGKTPTSIAAACALFEAGLIDLILVVYPNSVSDSWRDQLASWAGLDLIALHGAAPMLISEIQKIRDTKYAVVGCHYEILAERETDLAKILDSKRYALVADEIHLCKNRRAGRTQTLQRIARGVPLLVRGEDEETSVHANGTCVTRWGLTGTPMRNHNRDLWGLFAITQPGSVGRRPDGNDAYWGFAKRYCGAYETDEGYWTDKTDVSDAMNEELNVRLAAHSYRVTRREVAPWLPLIDRKIFAVNVPDSQLAKYRALEREFAAKIGAAIATDEPTSRQREELKLLCQATTLAKIPLGVQRVRWHIESADPDGPPMKLTVFAYYHETLEKFRDALNVDAMLGLWDRDVNGYEVYDAGGYRTDKERKAAITAWKATIKPAVLLCNSMSSGIGIDLSEAALSCALEPEWVPADFRQREDRHVDMHLGKRTVPLVIEYWLMRGTVDESMLRVLIEKQAQVDRVVGWDAEGADAAKKMREAGIVSQAELKLEKTDKATVLAALASLRDSIIAGARSGEVSVECEDLEDDRHDDTDGDSDGGSWDPDNDIPF